MSGTKALAKRVRIVDVARESGFAPSTVSIVLNDAPVSRRVPEETKQRIRQAAKNLGYRPNIFARSLRGSRSQTIGIIVFDISDPYCILALDGIERALLPTSYLPIIMDARGDREQFESHLKVLVERRVEGLIVVATWQLERSKVLLEAQPELPVVIIGRDLSRYGISSSKVDNEAGGYMALQHLYKLGHREIAIIRGPEKMPDGNSRWRGMQRFASEFGIALARKRIRQLPKSWSAATAFSCSEELARDLISGSSRFTALAAFDDVTALGAVRALSRAGYVVPKDCSVIGFDDVPQGATSTPGITTIRQPLAEVGEVAASSILESIRSQEEGAAFASRVRTFLPSLVIRDSTQRLVK